MWPKLAEICYSVQNNHNTIVESGFGCGKSVSAASLACWFMTVYQPAIVIVIAPTHSQVQNILFRYIRAAARKANLPGIVYDTPRWERAADHYAVGLSPRKSSAEDMAAIQGFHGPRVLVIMDEAAGLPQIIWDTIAGLAVGDNCRILAVGNPVEQSGPFWNASNNSNWYHIRISCLEHPNVVEGREVIPGAVTRSWIEERCHDWANEVDPETPEAVHIPWTNKWYIPLPIFMAKVLGIAPEQSEDQLIKLSWVIDAQNRTIDDRNTETVIGFDPAPRGGDDNALCIRYGNAVRQIKRKKSQDTQALAEWLALETREGNAVKIYIDDVGSGAGVTDRSRRMGLPVVAVNFSRSASQKKRFNNLRSECYWRVRELLREGKMSLPNDSMLVGDLIAVHYEPDDYGRIALESKDIIRAKIGRSPDSGDALCLSYATPVLDVSSDELISSLKELGTNSTGQQGSRWLVAKRRIGLSRWRG
jgi:hypothetical protein